MHPHRRATMPNQGKPAGKVIHSRARLAHAHGQRQVEPNRRVPVPQPHGTHARAPHLGPAAHEQPALRPAWPAPLGVTQSRTAPRQSSGLWSQSCGGHGRERRVGRCTTPARVAMQGARAGVCTPIPGLRPRWQHSPPPPPPPPHPPCDQVRRQLGAQQVVLDGGAGQAGAQAGVAAGVGCRQVERAHRGQQGVPPLVAGLGRWVGWAGSAGLWWLQLSRQGCAARAGDVCSASVQANRTSARLRQGCWGGRGGGCVAGGTPLGGRPGDAGSAGVLWTVLCTLPSCHLGAALPPTLTRCRNRRDSCLKGSRACSSARSGLVDRIVNSASSGGMACGGEERRGGEGRRRRGVFAQVGPEGGTRQAVGACRQRSSGGGGGCTTDPWSSGRAGQHSPALPRTSSSSQRA